MLNGGDGQNRVLDGGSGQQGAASRTKDADEAPKAKPSGGPSPLALHQFWERRNSETYVWLDRLTVNNFAPLLAYAGHVLRVTPNHLSAASAICAVAALIAGFLLPADQPNFSIILLYLMVQLSYAFDCADGLLARVSGAESDFGEFLDKALLRRGLRLHVRILRNAWARRHGQSGPRRRFSLHRRAVIASLRTQ
jgi:hypothetical protein